MMLFLVIGFVLGAIAVVFALQNITTITVGFLAWHATAPLAVIILGSVLCGIALTLLFLLPSAIRDEVYLASIKKQKREAEDELARHRAAAAAAQTPAEGSTTSSHDSVR